jgi:octaprenyl-diphosphate synthase
MTLPLIYTLQNLSVFEKHKIKFIVKYMNKNKDQVQYVIDKVIASGGIDYATQKMQEYIQKAKDILNEFEDSESKKSLLQLIDYTILREK